MENNQVPIFISAEAILKPAKGAKSILEATGNDLARPRLFNATPQNVKKGVTLLKADGFTVARIGKGSLSIQGFRWQFEQTFKIELHATDTGITTTAAKRFGIIEIQETDRYKEIFAGFVLARPEVKPLTFKGTNPPEIGSEVRKATQITPAELPQRLGGGELYQEYLRMKPKKKIKIAVLDTGCYKHGYFKNWNENVKVIKDFKFLISIKTRIDALKLLDLEGYDDDKLLDLENELEVLKESLENYMNFSEHPTYSHGTWLIPQILSISPHASVDVHMIPYRRTGFDDISIMNKLKEVINKDADIVSNSWGYRSDVNKKTEAFDAAIQSNCLNRINRKITVLFGCGNYDPRLKSDRKLKPKDLRGLETEYNKVISVGGAYRDRLGKVIASNGAFGYKGTRLKKERFIPDICGWVGNTDSNEYHLWLPAFSQEGEAPPKDAWELGWGGTSSATAQLAGVCAVIKQFWPGATSENIREILQLSANLIDEGSSAQEVDMKGKAGLVNIEIAIVLAREQSERKKVSFSQDAK